MCAAGVLVVDTMQLTDRARLVLAHALQQGSIAAGRCLTAPVSAVVWAVQPDMSSMGSSAKKPSKATQTAMASLTAAVDIVLPWTSLLHSPDDMLLDARPASPVSCIATQDRPACSPASLQAATGALSAVSGQPSSIYERAAAERGLQGAVAQAALQLEPVWDPTAAALAQVYFTARRQLQVATAEGPAGVGILEALMRLAAACARLHCRRYVSAHRQGLLAVCTTTTYIAFPCAGRCSPCRTWRLPPFSWTGQPR